MKIKYLLIIAFTLTSLAVLGQPPVPPATPIDGGLGVLLAGGVLFGMSKIRKLKR